MYISLRRKQKVSLPGFGKRTDVAEAAVKPESFQWPKPKGGEKMLKPAMNSTGLGFDQSDSGVFVCHLSFTAFPFTACGNDVFSSLF